MEHLQTNTLVQSTTKWVAGRQNALVRSIQKSLQQSIPQTNAAPSDLKAAVLKHATEIAYQVIVRFRYAVAFGVFCVYFMPILIPILASMFNAVPLLGSYILPLLVLVAIAMWIGGVVFLYLTYRRAQAAPEAYRQLAHPYIYGNLNIAKSLDEPQPIAQLLEESVEFIQEFGLDQPYEHRIVTFGVSTNESNPPNFFGKTISTGESVGWQVSTLNHRLIRRARRSVGYVLEDWEKKDLSDYERDKMLDELHEQIERASASDPTEWTRDILFGNILALIQREARKSVFWGVAIYGFGWFLLLLIAAAIAQFGPFWCSLIALLGFALAQHRRIIALFQKTQR